MGKGARRVDEGSKWLPTFVGMTGMEATSESPSVISNAISSQNTLLYSQDLSLSARDFDFARDDVKRA